MHCCVCVWQGWANMSVCLTIIFNHQFLGVCKTPKKFKQNSWCNEWMLRLMAFIHLLHQLVWCQRSANENSLTFLYLYSLGSHWWWQRVWDGDWISVVYGYYPTNSLIWKKKKKIVRERKEERKKKRKKEQYS